MSEERSPATFPKSTPEEVRKGKTQMMVGDEHGQVFVRFPQPMEVIVMEPGNAFPFAEAVARAAHKAKFGQDAPSDIGYLQQQIKQRVTDELRTAMIARTAIMLNNMQTNPKTPGYWALQIVDQLLNKVEG